ncbi:MAG: S-methyl-5'-thioadenosine phosphorylase [Candidatus Aenigmatarchaeota archaeon]
MQAEIAIIGGSGLYDSELLEDKKEIKLSTPFGRPSDLITIGTFKGRKIAFLPRHGKGHHTPPHLVNSRANIWALKELGVKRILASSACGSLREEYRPGDIMIIDQFVDMTRGRKTTFYEGGKVCHISAADPFCRELRKILLQEGAGLGTRIHSKGTYICINGPRFSTRAESKLYRSWGMDVIGMTLVPECVLAKELEICYATVALVTDYDVWAEKPVDFDEVLRTMGSNVHKARQLFSAAIGRIPQERTCSCKESLKNALI